MNYSQTTLLSIQDSKKNRNNSSTDLYWFYNDLTILLQACSSAPAQNHTVISSTKIALPDYLEQYIAQHVSSIRRELNLRHLGYETLGAPIQTPNQLSYTIVRRIQIPTPMPTMRSASSVGAIPIPTHTPFYDV